MARVATIGLVLAAALADHSGSHTLAFDALLLAVPVTAYVALRELGRTSAYLWGVVLTLLLLATSARAPALGDASVPPIARSALMACIVVFCLQALVALADELRASGDK
jgi:hypothetical protein